jgi:predicted  nucleic acid-binding Zn-ribbon protein
MSHPFKLFRLQQIDSQLDKLHNRLRDIEALLSDNLTFRRAKTVAEVKESNLENARKSLRRAEENVLAQQIKMEQTEVTLYSGKVSNPKELQDLHNESAALKRYLNILEDRQLEEMIRVEEAEVELKDATHILEKVNQESTQLKIELSKEQSSLIQEVERLNYERQVELNSIPSDVILLYENLRQIRRGVAVAKVTDNTCSACGSTLTTALRQAAQSPGKITYCESCGRILYGG